MGDHQHATIRRAQCVHTVGNDLQRIDIEAGIGFVEYREFRFEYRHLQNFVTLLLAAGETDIERAPQHIVIDVQRPGLLSHELQELHRVHSALPAMRAHGVHGRLQERRGGNARNFDGILKSEKQAGPGALVRIHFHQICAVEQNLARGHFIAVAPRQHV